MLAICLTEIPHCRFITNAPGGASSSDAPVSLPSTAAILSEQSIAANSLKGTLTTSQPVGGYQNTQHGKAAPMLASTFAFPAQPTLTPFTQQLQGGGPGSAQGGVAVTAQPIAGPFAKPVGHRNTLHGKAASILGSSIVPTMQGALSAPPQLQAGMLPTEALAQLQLSGLTSPEEQQAALQRAFLERTLYMQVCHISEAFRGCMHKPRNTNRSIHAGECTHQNSLAVKTSQSIPREPMSIGRT